MPRDTVVNILIKNKITPARSLPVLGCSLLQDWTDAIENDDVAKAESILLECTDAERRSILYGDLHRDGLEPCGHDANSCECYLTLPKGMNNISLNLVIAAKARKVLAYLLTQVYDLWDGAWREPYCYIFHLIVYNAYFSSNEEIEYVALFNGLKDTLSAESVTYLLKVESCEGSFPLEMAAQLECFLLFEAIFNTDGVYVWKRMRRNILCYTWYDVTDYEHPQGGRRYKSPLFCFTETDRASLTKDHVRRFFHSSLVKKWFDSKLTAMWNPTLVFVLLELIRCSLFIITAGVNFISVEQDHQHQELNITSINESSQVCYVTIDYRLKYTLLIIMILIQCVHMLASLVFIMKERCVSQGMKTNLVAKTPAINLKFFTLSILLFTISVSIRIIIALLHTSGVYIVPLVFINFNTIIAITTYPWVVMFYIQLTPIGYFVLIIQNMFADLVKFWIIFCIFLGAFALGFLDILSSGGIHCENGTPGFTSLWSSQYAIFSVMLNMIPIDSYKGDNYESIKCLHVVFVMVVPIVLLNFLIGLFSDTVQRITEIRDSAQLFQKFRVISLSDHLVSCVTPGYYRKRQKMAFAHKNDRFYLVVTSASMPFEYNILNM